MKRLSFVALALCACAGNLTSAPPPSKPVGPTTGLPPVALDKMPFGKAEGARFFTEQKEGVAIRPRFTGAADLAVEQQDLHLGPRASTELKPNGAAVAEVREGQATVTIAGKGTQFRTGGVFTVGDGQAATVAAGEGPLALRVTYLRARGGNP